MSEAFPTSPAPMFPVIIEPVWNTIITSFDGANEQRRQKWAFAKYNVTLKFDPLTASEFQTLWAFYMARKGSFEPFYYYPIDTQTLTGLYVGTGDNATEVFDLPGKTTSAQTIYVDGVLQILTTDYVILTGGGDGSADRVDFVSPPAEGEVITCGFTGYLRIRCRFSEDRMTREWFTAALYRTGLELKGLAAA